VRKQINIISQIGGTNTNAEGFALYTLVSEIFESGQSVDLSFKGCLGLSSSFLNSFLGELFDKYGVDYVTNLIDMSNLLTSHKRALVKYVKDFKNHYA